MVAPMMVLAAVPLQLAAAAGVELAGGYDSTVLNQLTQSYSDGGIARAALDLQIGYRGDTTRHLLRTRAEGYYLSNEGRSFTEGDFLLINRYLFRWDPNDDTEIGVEGTYSIGRSGLLLGRSNSTDLMFLPGIAGEYIARLDVRRAIGERNRISLSPGIQGRHAVSQPLEVPRQNMVSINTLLEYNRDFSDRLTGIVAGRGEYFLVDGFLDWVPRFTGYVGVRRVWNEDVTSVVHVGIDSLRDQYDASEWFVGPYAMTGLTWRFPNQHLVLGLNGRYEYAIVAAARCNVPVMGNAQCPRNEVVAGGTGRVLGGDFSAVWRPGEGMWSLYTEASGDYGVTANFALRPDGSTDNSRIVDVGNTNLSVAAGVRFIASRNFSIFTRYNFLYSHLDVARLPGLIPEIVRHVVMLGVTASLSNDNDGATESLIPFEEAAAMHAARGSGGGRSTTESSGGSSGGSSGDEGGFVDPFDVNTNDPEPGGGGEDTGGGGDGDSIVAPTPGGGDAPNYLPPGRGSTRTSTQRSTQRATQPTRRPAGTAGAPAGGAAGTDGGDSAAPEGGSDR